ncbi:MAG: glycosyltransferase [Opitutaceae bacterium]
MANENSQHIATLGLRERLRDACCRDRDSRYLVDPRIRPLHRQPPNGVGRAIADGLRAATGKYVLTMDGDFQR